MQIKLQANCLLFEKKIINMKHKVLIILVLFLSRIDVVPGQTGLEKVKIDTSLSGKAEISLLTFDPGTEVYSVWGHTAIRIKDPASNIDEVYNYGTFDFDQPGFVWKFLKGKLEYFLSHDPYDRVEYAYKYYKRGIHEQVLNLSTREKGRLFWLLKDNYKPEHRFYKYDFFFDNCSTRPLAIIQKSLDGNLIFKKQKSKKTFRQLLYNQIYDYKWLDFGINLIIGNKADKYPTSFQSSFLPLILMKQMSNAKVEVKPTMKEMKSNKTVVKKMVNRERTLFEFDKVTTGIFGIFSPIWLFTFLFLLEIGIFYFSYKNGRIIYKWYDKIWFTLAFAGAIVIVFMWFFTDHQATKNNWNLLVLNPLYLFMFFDGKWRKIFAWSIAVLLFGAIIFYSIIPQQLPPAIIPIAGLLLLKVSKYGILSRYFES